MKTDTSKSNRFILKSQQPVFAPERNLKPGRKRGKQQLRRREMDVKHQQNIKLHANNIREARHLKIWSWSRRLKILNKECSLFKFFRFVLDKPLSKYTATSCARLDTIASGMEETNVIRDCEHRQYITCIC